MATEKVVWWNLQRLLHADDSPLSRALDATPKHGWTREAYHRKVHNVASVIRQLAPERAPALLGLCEVENSAVVADLLAALGWPELVEAQGENGGFAGSDVVLLYSSRFFEVEGQPRSHNVHNRYETRDIFEVRLGVRGGAVLTVLLNHWPSRRISTSEALRIGLADYCSRLFERSVKLEKAELVDPRGEAGLPERQALLARWNTPALVFGDFNDDPFDVSVSQVLGTTRRRNVAAAPPRFSQASGADAVASYLKLRPRLYNPTWQLLAGGDGPPGTYFWNGEWYFLDQVAVSAGLLQGGALSYVEGSLRVEAPSEVPGLHGGAVKLLTPAGYPQPFNPQNGVGVSDHLPLVCELNLPD